MSEENDARAEDAPPRRGESDARVSLARARRPRTFYGALGGGGAQTTAMPRTSSSTAARSSPKASRGFSDAASGGLFGVVRAVGNHQTQRTGRDLNRIAILDLAFQDQCLNVWCRHQDLHRGTAFTAHIGH